MAQDKRTFMGGMNKDADVRLIKNPDYIDALNIRVVSSTDGTVGSVENIEGNTEVPFDFYSIDQEILFVNDNGLYEQINPSTVFYQKVIRIEGWEQLNVNYNFTLYSVTPNGNIPVGEFNWVGNNGHTFTAQYLYSQFSTIGGYNTGINVYDVNTGSQYTASVKLLSFGQNSSLNGGYLDIVIECDISGVNFNLAVDSNVNPDQYTYSYSEDSSIPISSNENVSISLLPTFETGGSYNTDATDQGFVISPDGAPYQVDNRTVWFIEFAGMEPTSPESFDPVIIYSYRDNLNPGEQNETFEFEPLLTIDQSLFSSGATYEFDSNQNNLSEWLHTEFSESKSILCDGLPLDFTLPSDSFFLTFSDAATFDNTFIFKVVVVGPVGVRFKLALGDSSESLNAAFSAGDVYVGNNAMDSAQIFGNGSFVNLRPYQMIENSISITNSIVNSFNQIQDELENAISVYEDLMMQNVELNTTNNNLEVELEYQTSLAETAQDNLDQTTEDLNEANALNDELNDANNTLQNLNQQQGAMIEEQIAQIASLEQDVMDLLYDVGILNALLASEQETVTLQGDQIIDLTSQITVLGEQILSIDLAHSNQLFNLQQELGGEIEVLQNANDNLQAGLDAANLLVVDLTQQIENNNTAHAAEIANLLSDHADALAVLHLSYGQQLQNAADASSAAEDELFEQYQSDLDALHASYGVQIDGLQATIDQQTVLLLDNTNALADLNNQIEALQEELEALRISDLIVTSTLDQYNDTYTSISTLYNESLTIYNALSVDNAVIYEEDFSSASDFSGEWVLYLVDQQNFEYPPEPFTSIVSGNYNNPPGYENNGYLKVHTDMSYSTAARLPYNSFQSASGWQHGTEVTITIDFEMVNVSTGGGGFSEPIETNYEVIITNEWAADGEYAGGDFSDAIFSDEFPVTLGSGNAAYSNPGSYSKVFTVFDDGSDDFLDRLCNITIMCPPVSNTNNELRITNIRLGNTAQEQFSFELNNAVPEAESSYLNIYNIVNTHILNWQNSGLDSLEEYMDSSGSAQNYNYILTMVFPEFDNPSYNPSQIIPEALQAYTDAVIAFTSSVQTQVYTQYQLYSTAAGMGTEELETMIEQHALEVQNLENQITEANAEINTLQNSYDELVSQGETLLLQNILTSNNIGSEIITIKGPEPGAMNSGILFGPLGGDDGIKVRARVRVNGTLVNCPWVIIVSGAEIDALRNEPYSPTNNLAYYITQRFSQNQEFSFEIPGGQYPPQKANIYFLNFDENDTLLNSLDGEINPNQSHPPAIQAGMQGVMLNGQELDFDQMPESLSCYQFIVYFDQSKEGNIQYSGGGSTRFKDWQCWELGNTIFMYGIDFATMPAVMTGHQAILNTINHEV